MVPKPVLSTTVGKPYLSQNREATIAEKSETRRLFLSASHEAEPPVAYASSSRSPKAHTKVSETSISTQYGPGMRVSGMEYITTISTGAVAPGRGEVMFALPISPQVIPDTRISKYTEMNTRYIGHRITFEYLGTAPTTTAGSMVMFCDYDPSQNPSFSVGDGSLRYAFTHDASDFSVWEKAAVTMDDSVYKDMLYCDPDEELRWSVQGCFWVLSSGTLEANKELGKIVMHYEIDFAVPDFRGPITNPTAGSIVLSWAANSAAAAFTAQTAVALTPGSYFGKFDSVPATPPLINVSQNAYNQAAPAITLTRGSGFWFVAKFGSAFIDILWTPDVYGLDSSNASKIYNNITNAASSCTLTYYAIQTVSND